MPPHPQEFDPDPIIAAVLRGDTDRFRLLVREYGLLVRGFLATRLYHHEDVEDLVSIARSAERSVNIPLTRTGNFGGVMSTAATPAWNSALADTAPPRINQARIGLIMDSNDRVVKAL